MNLNNAKKSTSRAQQPAFQRLLEIILTLALLWMPAIALSEPYSLLGISGANKPYGNFEPAVKPHLALSGSRGETQNFMLRLETSKCLRLKKLVLLGPNRKRLSASPKFFRMETLQTRQPSYDGAYVGKIHDPLIPLDSPLLCPGLNQAASWFWGELSIPLNATPGQYQGVLRLGRKRGVRVTLSVWRMRMPKTASFPAYSEFSNRDMLIGHFGNDAKQNLDLLSKYTELMQEHRMFPIKSYTEYPPIVNRHQRPVLDIYQHPSPSASFYSVALKTRPSWAYFDFPTIHHGQAFESESQLYFRAVQNTLADMDPNQNAMIFLWDEPREHNIPDLIEYCRLVKRLAPSIKLVVTVPGLPELAEYVDIFVPSLEYFGRKYASFEDYSNLQQQGRELWAYVACGSHGCHSNWPGAGAPDFVVDRPAAYIKSLGWIAAKYDIRAFLYYSANYGYQFYPRRDPWKDLYDFGGNGDGTLLYPGRPGQHGLYQHLPLPSIRLKLWRETSFDVEYIRWANQLETKPAWINRALNQLVQTPQIWQRGYAPYQKLRNRLGRYLNRRLERT